MRQSGLKARLHTLPPARCLFGSHSFYQAIPSSLTRSRCLASVISQTPPIAAIMTPIAVPADSRNMMMT